MEESFKKETKDRNVDKKGSEQDEVWAQNDQNTL